MRTAAWTMRTPKRWTRALRALRLGRFVGRGRRAAAAAVGAGPARATCPAPPEQTLRDWWERRQDAR